MRTSLLLALAFFSAQIDHAPPANDHRIGSARFLSKQDLPNCKWEGSTEQVAQASSRTGGVGQSSIAGGISQGNVYPPNVGGAYTSGIYPGGTFPGGTYRGGQFPGGTFPGGGYPTGGPPVHPGGHLPYGTVNGVPR